MKRFFLGSVIASVGLLGCGGGGGPDGNGEGGGRGGTDLGVGEVSGVVFDTNGAIVRGASVYYDGSAGGSARQTKSNSAGSYLLTGLPGNTNLGVLISIRAEATINGVRCSGVNLAQVFQNDRTKDVNVATFPNSLQASIYGSVYTNGGAKIQGAHVFARPHDGRILTSAVTLSNSQGNYTLEGLRSGIAYDLEADALGYSKDSVANVTFTAGQKKRIDFQIVASSSSMLPAPANVYAEAWTSPKEVVTDRSLSTALESVKSLIQPKRPVHRTRNADNGYPIEIDVYWDRVTTPTVIGYYVKRKNPNLTVATELLRDPLGEFFADSAKALKQTQTYTYRVNAVDTDGDLGYVSNPDTVTTLGGLDGLTFDATTKTFKWNAAAGATKYTVYIFRQYPTVVPDTYFASPSVATNSYTYGGAVLSAGKYYYLIVGATNGGDAYTLSRVRNFTVQ